jgi:glycine betaine catabolism A
MTASLAQRRSRYRLETSLLGREYCDPDTFHRETEMLFRREWMCIGRDEVIPEPGDVHVVELGGDSIIVVRGQDGGSRAFYNVCRHRGARLCETSGRVKKVLKCGYHAWTYGLDGSLLGTPNISEGEGFVRADHPLWRIPLSAWGGFMFVNLADDPPALLDSLREDPERPFQFDRYGMESLRLGAHHVHEVEANWKIVVDNYNECLHCPSVHPELSALVPVFKRAEVEEDPDSWGVSLVEGATSFTRSGRSDLPPLPGVVGEDLNRFYGCYVFPNLMLNINSDTVRYMVLLPRSASHTTILRGYLFAKETVDAPGFDPQDVVEFGEMVAMQDWRICELAQRGVSTTPFARGGGVYPFQDRYLADFRDRYRGKMGQAEPNVAPGT